MQPQQSHSLSLSTLTLTSTITQSSIITILNIQSRQNIYEIKFDVRTAQYINLKEKGNQVQLYRVRFQYEYQGINMHANKQQQYQECNIQKQHIKQDKNIGKEGDREGKGSSNPNPKSGNKKFQQVVNIIRAYPKKRGKICNKNWELFVKMFGFGEILFDQIIVSDQNQGNSHDNDNSSISNMEWLSQVTNISAQHYRFMPALQLPFINLITQKLYAYHQLHRCSPVFQLQFNTKFPQHYHIPPQKITTTMLSQRVVPLIANWSKYCIESSKCKGKQNIKQSQSQSENQFQQKQKGIQNTQLKKLVLCHNGQLFISMEYKKVYGISLCLHRYSDDVQLCLGILALFCKPIVSTPIQSAKSISMGASSSACSPFISLQFSDWNPDNPSPVSYIFTSYSHHFPYLIKFSHNLQITQYRLFLNTAGMPQKSISNIFTLMKLPGHYQLICHSQKQYFRYAIELFLYKPLIRFQYWVPLAQAEELAIAIESMAKKADQLRNRVEIFAKMIGYSRVGMELDTVIKLFMAMSNGQC